MDVPNFEIRIPDYGEASSGLVGGSGAELSALSAEERDAARKFGLTDEQYSRGKMERAERGQRLRGRAVALGEHVQKIFERLGSDYKLLSVARNIDTGTWTLEISTPEGPRNVTLSWELVDDVLDSGAAQEVERLRNLVLFGVGRQDLIFKHEQ